MTDNEIVKAFRCCYLNEALCDECPCFKDEKCTDMEDVYNIPKQIIDLINRLQAEKTDLLGKIVAKNIVIDTQKAEVERLEGLANHHRAVIDELNNGIAEARAEAYKEFWNCRPPRLNEQFVDNEEYNKGWNACLDEFWNIRNNLLKELVGEDDG